MGKKTKRTFLYGGRPPYNVRFGFYINSPMKEQKKISMLKWLNFDRACQFEFDPSNFNYFLK